MSNDEVLGCMFGLILFALGMFAMSLCFAVSP